MLLTRSAVAGKLVPVVLLLFLMIAALTAPLALAEDEQPSTALDVTESGVYLPALAGEQVNANAAAHKVYLPTLSRRCNYSATPSIFGVQMYGKTGAKSNYHSSLIDSGASWVRVPIEWDSVQPTPGVYRWQTADAAVTAATDGCKTLLVTLRSAPGWAATYPNSKIDKTSLSEFAKFVAAVVERYDGDGIADAPGSPIVNYWELYNEPDASSKYVAEDWHKGWGEYGADYAEMLAVAKQAIKSANPNAQVVFGGIAYDYFTDDGGNFVEEFLADVLKAGGGAHFDIMNVHAYPAFGHVWIKKVNPSLCAKNACHGPGLLEKITYIRNTYKLDRPIMVTETGWHSDNPPQSPSSPELHARLIIPLYVQSKAAGVQNTMYFALADPPGYPYAAGLVTADVPPQRKEAFTAYQVAVDWLASAKFERRLPATELKAREMDAYQFYHPGRGHTFYVAWLNPVKMGLDLNKDGKPDLAENLESLRLLGNVANVYNIYGKLLETVRDTDGDVRIVIGGQPRIIEIVE